MPGDSKGAKTIQTMLAAKKPGSNDSSKDSVKEKPSKQNKRSHSDVANDSVEGIDLTGIQNDLSEIKQSLQGTVTKTDLTNAMVNLVQQKDLKTLVSNIVQKLLDHFEEKITSKFECKISEATGKFDDKLDTLMIENKDLRERIRAKDRVIENLVEKVGDNNNRSIDALKVTVNIEPSDVLAIHRIPGKDGYQKPVIVKVKNTETKIRIMRQKRSLKNEVKLHDDISQRNLGLMARLENTEKFENVWFYNCNMYDKTETSSRIRFYLFDKVEEKMKKKLKDGN
ncbi:unnamed protein product [Mytilus edulis]|uniref:Uncharacterized protein n=1 Tax=Mytilus edulis TaxID=6550 RepID=A0A8S3R6A8_MYTED|nr:unnamed protein product [Mytilus edulis]